ncbi:hypothetical protein [Spirosoma sp. KUDC1026]|uniref:hypothetical protein n=1 Tax=Spirosoma sp. KUDC1026 TaxID=2745947 RepID=UPI00159B86BD|nr:hypothetical protein [Spirosoma sp. KUDC1026]QKZ14920.1 hypothetical protein HU175_20735 [Spirosoma sp. KUDC1026]
MKRTLVRLSLISLFISICLSACVTSQTKSIAQVSGDLPADTSSLRVFLLEKENPQDIEQLGVVALSVNSRPTLNTDEEVKLQLRKECQRLGANGAYRISDGTYYPLVVSYLVFKYKK